jgi:hypothetical protein
MAMDISEKSGTEFLTATWSNLRWHGPDTQQLTKTLTSFARLRLFVSV